MVLFLFSFLPALLSPGFHSFFSLFYIATIEKELKNLYFGPKHNKTKSIFSLLVRNVTIFSLYSGNSPLQFLMDLCAKKNLLEFRKH